MDLSSSSRKEADETGFGQDGRVDMGGFVLFVGDPDMGISDTEAEHGDG